MESPKQSGVKAAAILIRSGGTGALSVIDAKSGGPFVTMVNIAADGLLRPIILTSALSHHTQCLRANAMGAVMLHAPLPAQGDPLTTLRVSLTGVFHETGRQEAQKCFFERHPYADHYAGFGDFGYWRMEPAHAHIIAGFGRAYSVPFKELAAAIA